MSDSCYPMDCRLPGSSVHGIFQARILEWVAMSFSRVPLKKKTTKKQYMYANQIIRIKYWSH